jgi:hypothetical protein
VRVQVQVDSLVMGTGASISAGLDEGQMSFLLVLLLYRRLAGNKHLRPRLIPASSQTVVIQPSGLDGTNCIITTTTTTSTTTMTLTTTTTTSIPPTLRQVRARMLTSPDVFYSPVTRWGSRSGIVRIWAPFSQVLNLSAWSAAATFLSSFAGVGMGMESGGGGLEVIGMIGGEPCSLAFCTLLHPHLLLR